MYDTIEIISPIIEDKIINKIRSTMYELHRVDMATGEVLSRFTFDELEGSYDSRMSVKIISGNRIKLSCSLHKFIMGFNVFGGPDNIKDCCRYMVILVSRSLNINLPDWDKWEVSRVDIAYVFDLQNKRQAIEYIGLLRYADYPRRKLLNYGNGLYFPGSSTTIKIYHKGDEFNNHDKKRLIKLKEFYGVDTEISVNFLHRLADRLVRFEVEVRKRKIKYDKMDVRCGYLNDEYFINIYEKEIKKLFKEGESEMETVKTVYDVKERLESVYSKRKANNLFSYWSRIQMIGVQMVKNDIERTTWWRLKKDLAAAGVSLYGVKSEIIENLEGREGYERLYDFLPLPECSCNITGVFLDLKERIAQLELSA